MLRRHTYFQKEICVPFLIKFSGLRAEKEKSMKMKKMLALLLAAGMTLSMAACGGNAETKENTNTAVSTEEKNSVVIAIGTEP